VVDVASNAAELSWSGVVDNTPPAVDVRSPGERADGVVRFVVEVTDPSGVACVQLRLGDGDWVQMVRDGEGTYVHEWSTDTGDNQDLRYTVRATDGLGNAGETGHGVEIANLNVLLVVAVLAIVAAVAIAFVLVRLRRGGGPERP
jgi:hypothetical protein